MFRIISKMFLAGFLMLVASASSIYSAVPGQINYQGKVTDANGNPYTGTGYFKFAISDNAQYGSGTIVWDNDGIPYNETPAETSTTVVNGIFNITLGNTGNPNMQLIPQNIFDSYNELYLKVWYSNNGSSFETMEPSERLVSVGYSAKSEYSNSAYSITGSLLIVSSNIANGSIVNEDISDDANITGSKINGWNATNWDDSYSVVSTSGPQWSNAYSVISSSSDKWSNNAYSVVSSSSPQWSDSYSVISSSSDKWSNAYSVTSSSSPQWSNAYSVESTSSPQWSNSYSVISSSSDKWSNAYSVVSSSSPQWSDSYSVVRSSSNKWSTHQTNEDAINGIVRCNGTGTYSVASVGNADLANDSASLSKVTNGYMGISNGNIALTPTTTGNSVYSHGWLGNDGYWTAGGRMPIYGAYEMDAPSRVWAIGIATHTSQGTLYTYCWNGSAYAQLGYETQGGVWTDLSSRNMKTNFKDISVIDKVKSLWVGEYEMRKAPESLETTSEKHISPVAEDFSASFNIGDNNGIAAKDLAGVSLRGLQELIKIVENQQKEIDDLKTEIANLKK